MVPERARLCVALFTGVFVTWTVGATAACACSCIRLSPEGALHRAYVVAELTVLEVGDVTPETLDTGFDRQVLRVRLERIFKAPPGFADGDELFVVHEACNSLSLTPASAGHRSILYLAEAGPGLLIYRFCARTDSVWAPLPYALIESRRSWLAGRR